MTLNILKSIYTRSKIAAIDIFGHTLFAVSTPKIGYYGEEYTEFKVLTEEEDCIFKEKDEFLDDDPLVLFKKFKNNERISLKIGYYSDVPIK